MGPRAGLDKCEKLCPTGIRSPDRPARSQSLCRLRYSAHNDDGSNGDNNVIFSFDDFSCLVTFLFVTRRINDEKCSDTSS